MRFRSILAAGLLLTLAACEDPSNVGIGLVGGEGGQPVVLTLAPLTFGNGPVDDVTGETSRVLAGRVDDPLTGQVTATGYVDFGAASVTTAYRNGTVGTARLSLRRSYVYGDTASVLTFQLRSMPAEWTATGASPDTTLPAGDVVVEFSFTARDSVVVVPLPAAWVTANDAILRGTTFAESFHGFQLTPVSGNAVVGFDRTRSFLRAFTAADSATFTASKTLTGVVRGTPAMTPEGRLLLQDAAGPGVQATFALDADSLRQSGLNRAVFRFSADTLLAETTPAGFVRPTLTQLDLFGITATGGVVGIERATMDSTGTFSFGSDDLVAELQAVFLGNQTFQRFELRVPPAENSISTLFLYDRSAGAKAPQALLTLTRVEP